LPEQVFEQKNEKKEVQLKSCRRTEKAAFKNGAKIGFRRFPVDPSCLPNPWRRRRGAADQ
jgi:hypothetical protein